MKHLATLLLLILLVVPAASAQDQLPTPTVRQINTLPAANIAELNSAGASLTSARLTELVTASPFRGQEVEITVVLLTTPTISGFSSARADTGLPGRLHVFARDTSAATQGARGNDIQIVDGNFTTTGLAERQRGEVVTIRGTVGYFNQSLQFAPTNERETVASEGFLEDFGFDESLLAPTTYTLSEINGQLPDGSVQANWDNLNDLVNAYVRLESATVIATGLAARGTDRSSYIVSQDGGDTWMQQNDISLCFRNDRSNYPDAYLEACKALGGPSPKDSTVTPPSLGSVLNLQGFVSLNGAVRGFADFVATPAEAHFQINPFLNRDVVVATIPNIQNIAISAQTTVVGNSAAQVTASVDAVSGTIGSVEASVTNSADGTSQTLAVTDNGDGTYTASVPAQPDGAFVTVQFDVIDSQGLRFNGTDYPGGTSTFRVLYDGINEIEDIRRTASGGVGGSPFASIDTDMNLNVTVQNRPGLIGGSVRSDLSATYVNVQDGTDKFDGLFLAFASASDTTGLGLKAGSKLTITSGEISDRFGVTYLIVDAADFSVTSMGTRLDYVTLTTDELDTPAEASGYVGMNVRFANVTVTALNADPGQGGGGNGFGEFSFASSGQASLRSDDFSSAIPSTLNLDSLTAGQTLGSLQGVWNFSFGNYKLVPQELTDINGGTFTSIGDAVAPGVATLFAAAPNPASGRTDLRFELAQSGTVTLDVYDALGRKIVTLVDEMRPAGKQSVSLDASRLSSGIYFVRMTAGGTALTRSLTVLR